MRNPDLAADYVRRSVARLAVIDVLFDAEAARDGARHVVHVVAEHMA